MRKEGKIAIENNLLDKILENRKSNESIDDYINKILEDHFYLLYKFDIKPNKYKKDLTIEEIYKLKENPNFIILSNKTNYELKKTKELFNNLDIAGNKEDELIGYALRLIQNINNTKLPRKE
ncbi:hypothetical protein [Arcobacter sp.]|jgi:hypothetical protein|uniref:hypothetical protein n=1 Tax=Arcobacter sp. TaxID=1872629 RepID=UPI003D0A81D4